MKIEILKPVSVESVLDVDVETATILAIWLLMMNHYTTIGFNTEIGAEVIQKMPGFLNGRLTKNGFIREVPKFGPFNIRVETAEECMELGRHSWKHHRKLANIWEQIKPHFIKVEGEDEPDE